MDRETAPRARFLAEAALGDPELDALEAWPTARASDRAPMVKAWAVFGLGAALALVGASVAVLTRAVPDPGAGILLGFLLFAVHVVGLYAPQRINRGRLRRLALARRAETAFYAPHRYELGEDGVSRAGPEGRYAFPWSVVTEAEIVEGVLVLCLGAFEIVPIPLRGFPTSAVTIIGEALRREPVVVA